MKTYTLTEDQMTTLIGAAHSGGLLGGEAAYNACLKIGAVLAEVRFREDFDKSPGTASENPVRPRD